MKYNSDYDAYIPLADMMAQVDRLAKLCELELNLAWEHPDRTLIFEGDLDELEI